MRTVFLASLLVLVSACGGGDSVILRPLPALADPAAATEVTVVRLRSIIAAEFPVYIVIAGQPVFDLRNAENTRFRVAPGLQPLVIRCLGGPLTKPIEARLDYDFPPRGSAYFIVEPKNDCVTITAVDARGAATGLRTTYYRPVGTVNPAAQAYGEAPAVFGPALTPAEAAALAAAPVSSAASAAPGAQQQVAAATAAWVEAFNSRDVARIASLYDPDAVLRDTSGRRIAAGPAAIAEYFRNAKSPVTASLGEQEIRVFGDTAVDSGTNTLGRYNIVYRNRGGKWLIVDHNTPPVAAP